MAYDDIAACATAEFGAEALDANDIVTPVAQDTGCHLFAFARSEPAQGLWQRTLTPASPPSWRPSTDTKR